MFRLLRYNLVEKRGYLLNGDSRNPISDSVVRYISTTNAHNSFTVSYLMNSCGLSLDKAVSVSKKVQFETADKPNSVLDLFTNYEFPNTFISIIIQKRPLLLLSNADRILKPKLDFFNSIGLSGPDLAKLLSKDASVLTISLEKQIVPTVDILKQIVGTDNNVVFLLRRSTWVLQKRPEKFLAPNISVLKAQGVPDSKISMLLANQPRLFLTRVDRFKAIVEKVKKMEIDPLKSAFVGAVHALAAMSETTKQTKLDVYGKWGYSEEQTWGIFKTRPKCLSLSTKNITCKMEFFVNNMGYDKLEILKYSGILALSMEKRIIPRCSVLKLLISNGLVEKECKSLNWMLKISDKDFLDKVVTKFENRVPGLLDAYKGKQVG